MTAFAPIATLATPCTLLHTDGLTIQTQKLLLDGEATPDGVLLHHHNATHGGFYFLSVPAAHLLVLDLDDATLTRVGTITPGHRYALCFKGYQAALHYLAKHYGLALADDRAPTTADASPCPSSIVVPAHLSTPPRLTRRPLSTPAFSPIGVMHMSKKQPIRVFLDQEIHSRYLIQAGTNGLTPSALGEHLIQYGLTQLESGEKAPLNAPAGDASPAPHGNGA